MRSLALSLHGQVFPAGTMLWQCGQKVAVLLLATFHVLPYQALDVSLLAALRLQVLEFFNRFYKDGGKPYRPLNIDPEYVEMIKEDS